MRSVLNTERILIFLADPRKNGWKNTQLFRIQIQWSLHHRFVYVWIDNTGVVILNLPSLKLTVCPWRWTVGRWVSFWVPECLLSGAFAGSFREGSRALGSWVSEMDPKSLTFQLPWNQELIFVACLFVRNKTEKTTCFGSILVEGALARVEQDPKKEQQAHKAPCSLMNAFFL